MKITYQAAMERGVFPHEGGYTNHPSDPGGPTNWGITIYDARKYWKPDADAADVKAMPKFVAADIYARHYAAPVRYNELPAGVDYSVLDYAINSGVGRSGKVLRRLVGLPDTTSAVTDDVVAAVLRRDPNALIGAINDERLRFLKSLRTWPTFGPGWGRRVSEVRALSLHFVDAYANPMPQVTPTPDGEAMAKAKVPEPKTVKNVVVAGGGVAATSSAGLVVWARQHPALAAAAVAGTILIVGGAIYLINRHHQRRQETPTPGTAPVPEAA